jgi:hypothetical protein
VSLALSVRAYKKKKKKLELFKPKEKNEMNEHCLQNTQHESAGCGKPTEKEI